MKALSRSDFLKASGVSLAALLWLAQQGRLPGKRPASLWQDPPACAGLPGAFHQSRRGTASYRSIDWGQAIAALRHSLLAYRPEEIVFLLGCFPDHVFDFVQHLAAALGGAGVLRYSLPADLEGRVTLQDAAQKLFGVSQVPYFDLWNAEVVFSFGVDSSESWLPRPAESPVPDRATLTRPGRGCHWVQFDALCSPLAQQADEWVRVRPASQGLLAQALAQRVRQLCGLAITAAEVAPLSQAAALSGVRLAELERLARRFASARGAVALPGAALLGEPQGLSAAQAVLSLNIHPPAGVGDAFWETQTSGLYFHPQLPLCSSTVDHPATLAEMTVLIERLRSGQVKLLLVHGADPAGDLPVESGFTEALQSVERVISFSPRLDATSVWADYLLPDNLEQATSGYQRPAGGYDRPVLFAMQPQAEPQGDTRPVVEVLLAAAQSARSGWAAALPYTSQLDFLQQTVFRLNDWGGAYQAEARAAFWSAWLEHGGWFTSAALLMPALALPGVRGTPVVIHAPHQEHEFPLTLSLFSQPEVARGETPWILFSPTMLSKLGLQVGQAVEVCSAAGTLQALVRMEVLLEDGAAAMPLTWGKKLLNPVVNEAGSLAWSQTAVRVRKL